MTPHTLPRPDEISDELERLRAERDALKAAIAKVHEAARRLQEAESPGISAFWAAELLKLALALAATEGSEERAKPKHIGGRANAEDCPGCAGLDLPYPWICPGEPETSGGES